MSEAVQTVECLACNIIEIELFLCLSWRHMGSGGIAPQILNHISSWEWVVRFILWYFVSLKRSSVHILNIRLSIYHVNQQTKFDMEFSNFTDSCVVQRHYLLYTKSSIIFHLLHICPFFTHTTASIVKLKVLQCFVLSTSCVPERVGINQRDKN